MALSLNLGKDAQGNSYLVLANLDTSETYPLAIFLSPDHTEAFTRFMETQGYVSLQLPTQDDIDAFLDGQ